jgi:hypothetical protein
MFLKAWLLFMAASALAMIPPCASAQTGPVPATKASSDKAAMAQLVALRDSFVTQIKAEGFQHSLPPPEILLDNPPSYGAYDGVKNVVHVAL